MAHKLGYAASRRGCNPRFTTWEATRQATHIRSAPRHHPATQPPRRAAAPPPPAAGDSAAVLAAGGAARGHHIQHRGRQGRVPCRGGCRRGDAGVAGAGWGNAGGRGLLGGCAQQADTGWLSLIEARCDPGALAGLRLSQLTSDTLRFFQRVTKTDQVGGGPAVTQHASAPQQKSR